MAKIVMLSLGCSKNLVDAEQMLGVLAHAGHEIITDAESADVIIVNTCAFIDDAKEESIEEILNMSYIAAETGAKLIVCGCLAQRYKEEILKEIPEVDAVVGVTGFPEIARVVASVGEKKQVFCPHEDNDLPELPRLLATDSYTAYLKIAEGCSNHCTYCAIPKIRGKFRSRPMEAVLAEAKELAVNGVKELIVIAQDTSRYGMDFDGKPHLAELLSRLCEIEDLRWIRVHYTYPECIDDDLLEVYAKNDKLLSYFDIPIQHASDKILKLMGRNTTNQNLCEVISKIRRKLPDAVIRTTVMVGFPGEDEDDFSVLMDFIKQMRFDRLGGFAYSEQEDTPSAKLPDKVDEETKQRRYQSLMETQHKIALELTKNKIGEIMEVVVCGFEDLFYVGRSRGDSLDVDPKVYFTAERELCIGEFVQVEILNNDEYDLIGREFLEGDNDYEFTE